MIDHHTIFITSRLDSFFPPSYYMVSYPHNHKPLPIEPMPHDQSSQSHNPHSKNHQSHPSKLESNDWGANP